jgi:cytoskeleton protein RodZ
VSKLDPIQLEQLKEIGVHLHQTREQQSKSLEEVAAKTFIPLRLLQAIEVGQATVLPEPVFIQGFIRRYGDVVGLDGIALSRQFSLDTTTVPAKPEQPKAPPPQFTEHRAIAPVPDPGSKPVYTQTLNPASINQPIDSPNTVNSRPRQEPTHSESTRTSTRFNPLYALYGLAGITIIGGAIFLISQFSPQSSESTPPETSASSVVDSPSAPPDSPPAPSPIASPQPSVAPSSDIEVSVDLANESWLRVTVDGEIQYEGILPQGEQRTWTAKEQLIIRAGNAGAVLASFNGAAPQPLGNQGAVATVTFPEAE